MHPACDLTAARRYKVTATTSAASSNTVLPKGTDKAAKVAKAALLTVEAPSPRGEPLPPGQASVVTLGEGHVVANMCCCCCCYSGAKAPTLAWQVEFDVDGASGYISGMPVIPEGQRVGAVAKLRHVSGKAPATWQASISLVTHCGLKADDCTWDGVVVHARVRVAVLVCSGLCTLTESDAFHDECRRRPRAQRWGLHLTPRIWKLCTGVVLWLCVVSWQT